MFLLGPNYPDTDKFGILLLGGTGFFGRSILRFFLKTYKSSNAFQVYVLSRNVDKFLKNYPEFSNLPWLNFYEGDILKDLNSIDISNDITHLIHAATDSVVGPGFKQEDHFNQIVNGTLNILRFFVFKKLRKLLFISSGAVYGTQSIGSAFSSEENMISPDPSLSHTTYGISKIMAEHLCKLYSDEYKFDFVVARCFAFVGEDLPHSAHFAIGNFIYDAIYNNVITIKGSGAALRSYMYQEDLAEWLLTLLLKGGSGKFYNVGSDQTISIIELARTIRDLISPNKEIIIVNNNKSSLLESQYVPNIKKINKELNLNIKYTLRQAIELTANGYLSRLN